MVFRVHLVKKFAGIRSSSSGQVGSLFFSSNAKSAGIRTCPHTLFCGCIRSLYLLPVKLLSLRGMLFHCVHIFSPSSCCTGKRTSARRWTSTNRREGRGRARGSKAFAIRPGVYGSVPGLTARSKRLLKASGVDIGTAKSAHDAAIKECLNLIQPLEPACPRSVTRGQMMYRKFLDMACADGSVP